MATIPRPCRNRGCPNGVIHPSGYCDKCRPKYSPDNRPSAAKRGYDSRWRKYRAAFLARNPLCVACQKKGIVRAANVVDHIHAHKGSQALFWDPANHQALCAECHNAKTAKEHNTYRSFG